MTPAKVVTYLTCRLSSIQLLICSYYRPKGIWQDTEYWLFLKFWWPSGLSTTNLIMTRDLKDILWTSTKTNSSKLDIFMEKDLKIIGLLFRQIISQIKNKTCYLKTIHCFLFPKTYLMVYFIINWHCQI